MDLEPLITGPVLFSFLHAEGTNVPFFNKRKGEGEEHAVPGTGHRVLVNVLAIYFQFTSVLNLQLVHFECL